MARTHRSHRRLIPTVVMGLLSLPIVSCVRAPANSDDGIGQEIGSRADRAANEGGELGRFLSRIYYALRDGESENFEVTTLLGAKATVETPWLDHSASQVAATLGEDAGFFVKLRAAHAYLQEQSDEQRSALLEEAKS